MSDLLIRGMSDGLKRQLANAARQRGTNLSREAIIQIQKGLSQGDVGPVKAGEYLRSLIGNAYFEEEELLAIEELGRQPDRPPPDFN
jgi:antitoxin FitA